MNNQQIEELRAKAKKQMASHLVFGMYRYPDGRVAQLGTYFLDMMRHGHFIGMSGVGKSTMIGNLITQSMDAGIGVFVIEPHNDLVADALMRCPAERENDVCVFNPISRALPPVADGSPPTEKALQFQWRLQRIVANRAPGLNILEAPTPADIPGVVANAMALFRKVMGASWETSVRMRRVMQMSLNSLLAWRGDAMLDDFYQFLINEDFRNEVNNTDSGRGRNRYARQFWTQEFENWSKADKSSSTQPPVTRVQAFLTDERVANIVNQRKTTINFWDLMLNSKIVLAPVSQEMGEDVMQFLGTLLVVKMRSAGVSRAHLPQDGRPPFLTFIDECQNFIMPDLIQALAEDRKRGLGYIFAHQMASQMRSGASGASMLDSLMGNVGTRIVFQVGTQDGAYFAKGMDGLEPEDITGLERFNAYASFLVNAGNAAPTSMETFAKPAPRNDMKPMDIPVPKPEVAIDKADLDLVNRIEALPTVARQVEQLKGLGDGEWARFRAARRYRDAKLLQQLSLNPQLVPEKTERILIKSALKYDTPIYEVETEVERTLALLQMATGGDDEGGGGDWSW